MKKLRAEKTVYDLRKKIQQIQSDLDQLDKHVFDIPELITLTNLLRTNEYLSKTGEKKSELLSAYAQYSGALEELLSTVFDIQNDLKEILRKQSLMITSQRKKKSKPRSKTRKR